MTKRSKKSRRGGGAGKERKRLPLSPDILPNAVRQRTGGNDVLPLVNRLSIKLIDQNDIRFPFIKDQNMAEAKENSYFECPFDFEFALEETTQLLLRGDTLIQLKPEQTCGKDVLAVLPTGFGKSAIFQFLVGVKEKLSKETACILVICPLRSLIQNQIGEAISLGLTANYLPEASLDDAGDGKFQLLFSSAENVVCLRKRPARPALLK